MMGSGSLHSCSKNLSRRFNITCGSSLPAPVLGLRVHTLFWCSTKRESQWNKQHMGQRGKWEKGEHMKHRGKGLICACLSPFRSLEAGQWCCALPQLHPTAPSRTQQWHWNSHIMEMWAHACLLFHVQVFSMVVMIECSCQRHYIDRMKEAKIRIGN